MADGEREWQGDLIDVLAWHLFETHMRQRRLSPATIRNYHSTLKPLSLWLAARGGAGLFCCTPAQIELWLAGFADPDTCAASTHATHARRARTAAPPPRHPLRRRHGAAGALHEQHMIGAGDRLVDEVRLAARHVRERVARPGRLADPRERERRRRRGPARRRKRDRAGDQRNKRDKRPARDREASATTRPTPGAHGVMSRGR